MADRGDRRGIGSCDDRCGCPTPCPGGTSCRCTPGDLLSGEHQRCTCGDHCGCNPCSCSKTGVAGVGKGYCKCSAGCSCSACSS